MMTVKELVEVLKTFDQNLAVCIEDCEGWSSIRKEYIRAVHDGYPFDEYGDEPNTLIISQWDSHGNR